MSFSLWFNIFLPAEVLLTLIPSTLCCGLSDRQPPGPPVRRWHGYALERMRISLWSQFDSGMTCHSRSMNRRVVIPKCTSTSSSVAPPNGAHLTANSMRCSTSASGCLRLRFASIQAARRLWRHCRYSREFMGIHTSDRDGGICLGSFWWTSPNGEKYVEGQSLSLRRQIPYATPQG